MALRRSLAHRGIFNMTKISSPFSSQSSIEAPVPPDLSRRNSNREYLTSSESAKKGFFRRFLQKRPIVQSAMSTEFRSLPIGDKLIDKLKGMNLNRDRVRLDGLVAPIEKKKLDLVRVGISVDDAKKLLRLAQLERLKETLRRIPVNSIPYSEFVRICEEGSSCDQGEGFAKMLDESGAVIVLRDTVFLHPQQVAKAIEGVIPLPGVQPNDPRKKELEEMEKEKAIIDEEAEALVRKELWAGLGFLVVQTVGFMRLTFWELSWDIMEPVCFFVTSIYFMAGYGFFLRTSKDPSFEGFFESRFNAKQKRLMKLRKFDVERFNELKRACYPYSSESSSSLCPSHFDHSDRTLMCAMHH